MLVHLPTAAALFLLSTLETDWQTASPESQGMSPVRLDAVEERLAAKKTRAFLVVRNDRIVREWYAPGVTAATRQGTASLAKALVGGMSLAVAITDGRISLDDPAAKFIPAWKDDPRKSKVTVRHLGSHTSGMSDSTTENVKHEEQPGWRGDFWKRLDPPLDPFTLARDAASFQSGPGERLEYSNPGIAIMTYCVTAAIRGAPVKDIRTLLRDRVLRPIGVKDDEWSAGYGKTFTTGGLPLVASWGGGAFTPRAAARIGRLVLREGDWDGERILSKEAVRQVTGDAGLPGRCGMGWWTNGGGRYPGLPPDAVWGAGAGDQVLLVVPSLGLIVVRNGETLEPGPGEPPVRQDDVFTRYHDYRERILFEPVVEAIAARSPPDGRGGLPPPSPVIRGIRWAPAASVRRAAEGSDNWPLAWADDDALYGAYGDGRGFAPFIDEKLSLGLARITGGPSDFAGVNLRTPTGETRGDGAAGKKASGLICVDGTLYLLARNAANAQLAWSSDHGRTWTWAPWRFTESFGCPTFLDFGKDGAGSRDEFVYVYSPDADTAYAPADRVILARAPRTRIRERGAYELFAGLDAGDVATWTQDTSLRRPVLELHGRCTRPRVSYASAVKRYLLVEPVPGVRSQGGRGALETRFEGGLAVFDAPEPWGPWTTAFFADPWDMGPGDSASFPPRWMGPGGTTLHLVFSGGDAFSVRRADLDLGP